MRIPMTPFLFRLIVFTAWPFLGLALLLLIAAVLVGFWPLTLLCPRRFLTRERQIN